jgi:sucrose phosphorylase
MEERNQQYTLEADWQRARFRLDEKERGILKEYLAELYGKETAEASLPELERIMAVCHAHKTDQCIEQDRQADRDNRFTEQDVILITYGDLVRGSSGKPLDVLRNICHRYFRNVFNTIHILPFFPYSSDRGFSILDFRQVDPELGTWADIQEIKTEFNLMFDAVFNHISAHSFWFQEYLNGNEKFHDYFTVFDSEDEVPEEDLAMLLRPRTSSVLTPFYTYHGKKLVWTTFSADQVDLKFQNPEVLLRIMDTLLFYVRKGADIIRLDAVTYLWDELGTTGAHLSQTHTIIKLFRRVLDLVAPRVALITETNVPHQDNITYFGDGWDEAQMVYNFALPPLVLHTFYRGDTTVISKWADELTVPGNGPGTFFNFLDSHDGIGVMGARGILTDEEIDYLAEKVIQHGGLVSHKSNSDGSMSIYELNITFFDALNGASDHSLSIQKYLAARSIPLVLSGVPGVYLHGLIGSRGDCETARSTQNYRQINRMLIDEEEFIRTMEGVDSLNGIIANLLSILIHLRSKEKSFHPLARQRVILLEPWLFSLLRTSRDGKEQILCLVNVTDESREVRIDMAKQDLSGEGWSDLVSEAECQTLEGNLQLRMGPYQLAWLKREVS